MVKQAPFKPTDIGGCQMWLDGADSTTITGNITSIREKANNVSLSVSGTVTATTIGSQSSLNFDGTDYLFGNINNILTGTSFVQIIGIVHSLLGEIMQDKQTFQHLDIFLVEI
jgi:hypothetical protein